MLLFRTHDRLSPFDADFAAMGGQELVHAAPRPVWTPSMLQIAQQVAQFPIPKASFLSVFVAKPDQVFYPDDTLVEVANGRRDEKTSGETLASVLEEGKGFHPDRHFETGVTQAQFTGKTYLFTKPMKGLSVDVPNVLMCEITPESRLYHMLSANQVVPGDRVASAERSRSPAPVFRATNTLG